MVLEKVFGKENIPACYRHPQSIFSAGPEEALLND